MTVLAVTVEPIGRGSQRCRALRSASGRRWSAGVAAPALLAVLLLAACGGGGAAPSAVAAAAADEHADGEAEASDLDRPVAELLAARCEHDLLTHACDECRYEVGVVKVDERLFDRSAGGELEAFTVGSRTLGALAELNGEVRLDDDRAVWVSPRAAGVVRAVRADVGKRVRAGDVLAELESGEYREARAALARGGAALRLAAATAARERDLYARGICPQRDVLEAEAQLAQARADERAARGTLLGYGVPEAEAAALAGGDDPDVRGAMLLRSPLDGTVLDRSLSPGALVQPGDRLLLVGDTRRVWVIAALREPEVAALASRGGREPARAEVEVAAYPGRRFGGVVAALGGTLDEVTRTARARVVVDNPDGLLRQGMFARVRLALGEGQADGSLAVPEEAVLEDEGRSFVFVRAEGAYWVRRPVTTGRAFAGWVEVAGEVKAGDEIVTRGAFLLKSDVLRSKMGAGCAD